MGVRSIMRYFYIVLLSILLASCSFREQYTRVEKDYYTITTVDTTYKHHNPNSPDNDLNGVVSPSSKEVIATNRINQYDSIVKREYPDFIRLGVFESIGIFGGNSSQGLNGGIFGVYLDPTKSLSPTFRGEDRGSFLTGGIYRFGILEKRLRWFQDAKNWTYGFNLMEFIAPDAQIENSLLGLGVLNLTKRWYFRTEVPYFALGVRGGGALYPSLYGKGEGFAELGSIGGLNLRAYLGFAGGVNNSYTPMIRSNEFAEGSTTPFIVYGGLGVSVHDFINIVPETYEEWKHMKHSSWNISAVELGLLSSNSETSFLTEEQPETKPLITGFSLKLLSANISIPQIDERLYVGTSLMNLMFLGGAEGGMGILPIRVGWWQLLLKEELILDPFIEYSYFPSRYYNIGAKVTLIFPPFGNTNFSLLLGYAGGQTFGGLDINDLGDLGEFEEFREFGNFYVGFQINFKNHIFKSADLKHNKK